MSIASTALALIALPTLAAAGELTVGVAGSGADFDSIQDAIDAASPGDFISVLPGSYTGFVLDKAVDIAGAGADAVSVVGATYGVPAVEVTGIAALEEVSLSGLHVTGAEGSDVVVPQLDVHGNAGRVVLHGLELVSLNSLFSAGGPGLSVRSSHWVLVDACTVVGSLSPFVLDEDETPACLLVDSEVWIHASTVLGEGAMGAGAIDPTPALRLVDSLVYVASSEVRGGSGSVLPFACTTVGREGLIADGDSTLKLAGGPGTVFESGSIGAGGPPYCGTSPAGDIVLRGTSLGVVAGSVAAEASVAVEGSAAVDIGSFAYPTLASDPGALAPGDALTLNFAGDASASGLALASLGTFEPQTFDGVDGALALSPFALVQLGPIALDAAGQAALALPIPNQPSLIGADVLFQWLEATPQIALSNPTVVRIR